MKLFKVIFIVFLLLLISKTTSLSAVPSEVTSYEASALLQIQLKDRPRTEVVRVVGNLDGKNNNIGDVDTDGKADIQTEIVGMELVGTIPFVGGVLASINPGVPSIGLSEQLTRRAPDTRNLPARSFFDIFVELRLTPVVGPTISLAPPTEVLTSCSAVRLQGISRSLADLSGHYSQRMSGKITLCNNVGEPVGSLYFLAINLNSSKSN